MVVIPAQCNTLIIHNVGYCIMVKHTIYLSVRSQITWVAEHIIQRYLKWEEEKSPLQFTVKIK